MRDFYIKRLVKVTVREGKPDEHHYFGSCRDIDGPGIYLRRVGRGDNSAGVAYSRNLGIFNADQIKSVPGDGPAWYAALSDGDF